MLVGGIIREVKGMQCEHLATLAHCDQLVFFHCVKFREKFGTTLLEDTCRWLLHEHKMGRQGYAPTKDRQARVQEHPVDLEKACAK